MANPDISIRTDADDEVARPPSWEARPWPHDVAALVQAARQGDAGAFERLYQAFAPMVHGLLLSRLPLYEVDDVMQDVFTTAFRQLPTLREPAAFGGWLAAIARQRAAEFFRQMHRTESLDAASSAMAATDRRLEASLDARTVLEQIRRLPETYAETLTLRLVEGLTGPEIAAATGMTPDSVRVNLHRGLKLLRERLGVNISRKVAGDT
ncbi:MAG: sigma-70 family RNA polymerase sigma factor [Chloracidobacterium sp.]|nr:sigma-70 family RNA polymerase sigma factor [Chloracidobacterium sp.]MDW8217050.1 sigma-70 family RNA polymerase sigma factor [Acidobacteriota bacterium]